MDAAYVVGWIVGYAVAVGVGLLLTFWIIRAAILSALAEDRRRVASVTQVQGRRPRRGQPTPGYAQPGQSWLDEDGR